MILVYQIDWNICQGIIAIKIGMKLIIYTMNKKYISDKVVIVGLN